MLLKNSDRDTEIKLYKIGVSKHEIRTTHMG